MQQESANRGEKLFQDATDEKVREGSSLTHRAKKELAELFDFMEFYKEASRTRLTLVLFVEELDRSLQGRNVKVRVLNEDPRIRLLV